ncbi:hypothetical protein KKA00_11185, partial [bacterium]|nr:hypothetical protein [bacterium]
MADEEKMAKTDEGAVEESGKSSNPSKKLILLVAAIVLSFILSAAGNFVHLQMTYVPPEPADSLKVESHQKEIVEGPVLEIKLHNEPEEVLHDEPEAAKVDTLELYRMAQKAYEDSINQVVTKLQFSMESRDSLLNMSLIELQKVKKQLKMEEAYEDSVNEKKGVKLANIIENMPPKDAAAMLAPLCAESTTVSGSSRTVSRRPSMRTCAKPSIA